jgi:HEAT repeat protein
MSIRGQLSCGVAATVWVVAVAVTAVPADDAGPAAPLAQAEALGREGRFSEAYQRLVDGHRAGDAAALRGLARALLVRAMGSEDAFERWAGLRAARGLADPAFVAPARAQLRSGSRYEEALALEILATADAEGGRDAFVAALDSPFRTVRMRGLRALSPRPDPTLTPRLMLLATEDSDPDVRVLAIRTLRAWRASGAEPSLRHAVDDPSPAVAQEAVKALVALRDDAVVDLVRRRLASAPVEQRATALRLAGLAARPELLPDIAPYLADQDPDIRMGAARAVLLVGAGGDG